MLAAEAERLARRARSQQSYAAGRARPRDVLNPSVVNHGLKRAFASNIVFKCLACVNVLFVQMDWRKPRSLQPKGQTASAGEEVDVNEAIVSHGETALGIRLLTLFQKHRKVNEICDMRGISQLDGKDSGYLGSSLVLGTANGVELDSRESRHGRGYNLR
jgi:hypothetical protein